MRTHTGEALISPSITVRLLARFRGGSTAAGDAGKRLSPRELDVARSVARGRTNQEVAADLFLSLGTVKTHLANVPAELGLRNRVEVAAWAWENRLVDGP